jgi:formate dehydrogenase subunit delta
MANQIGSFFAAYPRQEAIDSIADHIRKFWDPRMRKQIFEHVAGGGAGLQELTLEAIRKLQTETQPA